MKKFVCLMMMMMCSLHLYGQNASSYFEWHSNGLMLTQDGKSFVVLDQVDKTKEVLYNEILVAITGVFNSPQTVLSTVENQLVSIQAINPVIWPIGGLLGAIEVEIHYVLKFHIKDNRIKIDAPYFSLLSFSTGGTQSDIEGWVKAQKFFNSDGTPHPKKGRQEFCNAVNDSFNQLIDRILNYKNTENDW